MIYTKDPLTENEPRKKREKQRWDKVMDPKHFKMLLDGIKRQPLNTNYATRDYMIFMLMGNLGLRIGEAATLKVFDVRNRLNSDPPMAVVPSLKKRKKAASGGRILASKSLFVHPGVARILKLYIAEHTVDSQIYLFEGGSNEYKKKFGEYGHLSTRQIENIFYSYCQACGFKEVYSSHSLRHMYGTIVWQKTQDRAFLRDQMGHASIEGLGVTNDYIYVNAERGKALIKLVGCIV